MISHLYMPKTYSPSLTASYPCKSMFRLGPFYFYTSPKPINPWMELINGMVDDSYATS